MDGFRQFLIGVRRFLFYGIAGVKFITLKRYATVEFAW